MFRASKDREHSKSNHLKYLRDVFFERLYIAKSNIFFSHDNQLHPPFLSDQVKLNTATKSDLVECFNLLRLAHLLDLNMVVTFKDYAVNLILYFIRNELISAKNNIDISQTV